MWMEKRMPFKTLSPTKQELIRETQKHEYSTITALLLDRRNGLTNNKTALRTFSAEAERKFFSADFQDSDVILIALKVKHQ